MMAETNEPAGVDQRLIARERRYRTIFNESQDEILVLQLDAAGTPLHLTDVNDACCAHLGRSREALLALPAAEVLRAVAVDLSGHVEALWARTRLVQEAVRQTPEGLVQVEWRAHLVELNEQPTVVILIRDVTERQRAEQMSRDLNAVLERRVRERTRELEEANRELEAFAYSVSHDLRAPLRAIVGFARILLEHLSAPLPEKTLHYLRRIQANAEQMSNLVDDLLRFSRFSRQSVERRPVRPADLVAQVLEELQVAERPAVRVDVAPMPSCMADPTLLRQVFSNLLGNALKFSARHPSPHVRVGAREEGGAVAYYVADNGVGFDMQYADKLFGVFQRLHRADEYEGTGVGLAIVQRIIHRHGGRVWAEARPGEGATFFFSLPEETST